MCGVHHSSTVKISGLRLKKKNHIFSKGLISVFKLQNLFCKTNINITSFGIYISSATITKGEKYILFIYILFIIYVYLFFKL